MAKAIAYITLSANDDGTYHLSVSNTEGYNRIADKKLTHDEAMVIATAVDEQAGTLWAARNQVSEAKELGKKRLKKLRDQRDALDKQIAELEGS